MAVKVTVPNPDFNKKKLGVQFKDGVGIFDDEKKATTFARRFGYEIEPYDEEEDKPFERKDKESIKGDYDNLLKKELQELLEDRNIDYKESETKKDYKRKLRLSE